MKYTLERLLAGLPRWAAVAAGVALLTAGLVGPSASPNEAVAGPPAFAPTGGPEGGDEGVPPINGPIPGHYIVVFHDDIVDVRGLARGLARANGLTLDHVYEHALKGFAAAMPEAVAETLAFDPNVEIVERDRFVHAIAQTLPTGIDRIEADLNTTADIDGSDERVGVDIAIIDTGIDVDHPDLNVFARAECVSSFPFGGGCDEGKGDDGNGHGSHVAGIAAAIDNGEGVVGVAPGARLWAIKVLKDDGSGSLSDVIAGVDYVTDHAADIEVANLSLGAQAKSDSFRKAIKNSVGQGVVYTVAAGNDSEDVYGPDGTFDTDDDFIPAAYPEAATISALSDTDGAPGGNGALSSWGGDDRNGDGVDDGEDDSFAWFSNFSASVVKDNPVNSPGAAIDLLTPGVDIQSTWKDGTYNTISGTSMASPHGAGLAALYIAVNGRASDAKGVAAIRQALIDGGVAQDSTDGLTTLNDPDANWETIGWAQDSVGDPPTVAITSPSDGATISGTIDIAADATDSDGSVSQVEFFVDSASVGTDTDGSDGWSVSWNSTDVGDGDHVIMAEATDNDSNTASDSITVTVDNVDDPPSVTVTDPKDGDTVSGTVTVTADASDDKGVDQVEFFVDSSSVGVDSDGSDGWSVSWDTTAFADGDHTVTAEATDTASQTASDSITVTVANDGGSSTDMYVWDIAFSQKDYGPGGSFHDVMADVTVLNDSNANGTAEESDKAVSQADVAMTLTHDTNGDGTFDCAGSSDDCWDFVASTNGNGVVSFVLKRAPMGDYEAQVTNITHDTYTYNAALDADNPDFYTLQ